MTRVLLLVLAMAAVGGSGLADPVVSMQQDESLPSELGKPPHPR